MVSYAFMLSLSSSSFFFDRPTVRPGLFHPAFGTSVPYSRSLRLTLLPPHTHTHTYAHRIAAQLWRAWIKTYMPTKKLDELPKAHGNAWGWALLNKLAAVLVPESLSLEQEHWVNEVPKTQRSTGLLPPRPIVKAGDIVLIRTPGQLLKTARIVTRNSFDHVLVVLKESKVLHVSPPKVRLLSLTKALDPKFSPVFLRPSLTPLELETFLKCANSFVGAPYNFARVIALVSRLTVDAQLGIKFGRPLGRQSLLGNGAICSDVVFMCLCRASATFQKVLADSKLANVLDYTCHGGASLNDFVRLNKFAPKLLRYVEMDGVLEGHPSSNNGYNESVETKSLIYGNNKTPSPLIPDLDSTIPAFNTPRSKL